MAPCRVGQGGWTPALKISKAAGRRRNQGSHLDEKQQVRPRAGDHRCLMAWVPVRVGRHLLRPPFRAAPKFTTGTVNGKDGWRQSNASYDNSINANNAGQVALGLGAQSLRSSNAFTTGAFGDQLFSAELGDEAGEAPDALAEGESGGVRQDEFDAPVHIRGVRPGQPAGGVAARSGRLGGRWTTARAAVCPRSGSTTLGAGGLAGCAPRPSPTTARAWTPGPRSTRPGRCDRPEPGDVSHRRGGGGLQQRAGRRLTSSVSRWTGPRRSPAGRWEQYYRNDPEQGPAGGTTSSHHGSAPFSTEQRGDRQHGSRRSGHPHRRPPDLSKSPRATRPAPRVLQATAVARVSAGPTGRPGATAGATGTAGQPGAVRAPRARRATQGLTPRSSKSTGKVAVTSRSLKASKRRKVSVNITCPRAQRPL